jgi:hypothetical protein
VVAVVESMRWEPPTQGEGASALPRLPRPITVVVADDQRLVRQGLRVILESEDGIEVVGRRAMGARR